MSYRFEDDGLCLTIVTHTTSLSIQPKLRTLKSCKILEISKKHLFSLLLQGIFLSNLLSTVQYVVKFIHFLTKKIIKGLI